MSRASLSNTSRLLAALSMSLGLVGCAEGPLCPELDRCGGDLVGAWAQVPLAEDTGKYCQEPTHRPPPQEYLQNQPTPVARQPVPENTNLDWCYSLVLTSDEASALKRNLYWWEDFGYFGGLVTYDANGEYSIDFQRAGYVSRYYSETCLTQYGHDANCKTFQDRLFEANAGAGEYDFFDCQSDPSKGGCNCSFKISEANSSSGVYSLSGSTVTHFSSAPTTHFTQAGFCVKGDRMEISGLNNSYLWDRKDLRSMELVRVNCADGVQGPGEAGIDCGLRCPMSCAAP
jgi:hypothetical protein